MFEVMNTRLRFIILNLDSLFIVDRDLVNLVEQPVALQYEYRRSGIGLGVEILLKAKLWLGAGAAPADVVRLSQAAQNFVTSFAGDLGSQSLPLSVFGIF